MTETMFDRTPPFSIEAEEAVLGGMLLDSDCIVSALEILTEASFYSEANRRVYRGMVSLFERGVGVDVVTLTDYLKTSGEMESVGGIDYLAQLVDIVPTGANIDFHADVVADKALQRRLVEQASHIIRDVYDMGTRTTAEMLAEAEIRILSLDAISNRHATALIKQYVWEAFEKVEKWAAQEGDTSGLSTGFSSIDSITTGLHPGELWVIAGRPSMGKTALVLDIAKNVALSGGHVWIKSLEMEAVDLTIRMMAGEARLDLQRIRQGKLTQEDHQRLAVAAGHLNTAKIQVDDNPVATIGTIRSTARRIHNDEALDLIVVDYLQLIGGAGRNRTEDVSDISRGLKLMARETGVPVIAVSQLSRGVEGRTNKRPLLSDLRDSGSIEQDADLVAMVYRPEYYMSDAEIKKSAQNPKADARGLAEILFPKQRNGPTGTVPLFFDKPTTRFSEWKDRVQW